LSRSGDVKLKAPDDVERRRGKKREIFDPKAVER
jgi:hypothetical protein